VVRQDDELLEYNLSYCMGSVMLYSSDSNGAFIQVVNSGYHEKLTEHNKEKSVVVTASYFELNARHFHPLTFTLVGKKSLI
jgi:hypothetical protein